MIIISTIIIIISTIIIIIVIIGIISFIIVVVIIIIIIIVIIVIIVIIIVNIIIIRCIHVDANTCTGRVTDDAFGDGRASKLTFLMYLNGSGAVDNCDGEGGDDGDGDGDGDSGQFSGGSTTFFRSGELVGGGGREERVVEARAVAPATGACYMQCIILSNLTRDVFGAICVACDM